MRWQAQFKEAAVVSCPSNIKVSTSSWISSIVSELSSFWHLRRVSKKAIRFCDGSDIKSSNSAALLMITLRIEINHWIFNLLQTIFSWNTFFVKPCTIFKHLWNSLPFWVNFDIHSLRYQGYFILVKANPLKLEVIEKYFKNYFCLGQLLKAITI